MHAIRAGVSLGTVRTGLLPLRTIAARPGGSGVSGCRRMSGRSRVTGICDEAGQTAAQRIAAEVVAAGRQVGTGRETGHRPGSSGHRPARARETALTRERTRAGKGAGRGTTLTWECSTLTWECSVGGEVSVAAERPRRCIWVLRRTWSVTVRRCAVSRAAAGRSVGGPPSSGRPSWRTAFAAFRRDDQAAGRVNGRWGEDSLAVGVNNVNRPGAAVGDAVAVERALSLVGGARVRGGRTRVRSGRAVGLS